MFFGYAVLNRDFVNAEWGYVSIDELRKLRINGIESTGISIGCPGGQARLRTLFAAREVDSTYARQVANRTTYGRRQLQVLKSGTTCLLHDPSLPCTRCLPRTPN